MSKYALNHRFSLQLTLYCIAHFLIDLASTCIVLAYILYTHHSISAFLAFYFIAFAGQMPLGLLADRINRNALVAACGCMLMVIAILLMAAFPASAFVPVVTLAALANALVHIGGGIDVLNHSGPRSGPLGLFVSPGAIGLYVGTALVHADISISRFLIFSLLLTATAILLTQKWMHSSFTSLNPPCTLRPTLPARPGIIAFTIAALFLIVTLRSYVGLTLSFDWKTQWHWALFLLIALVAGKAFGGLLSDRFGMMRTAAISLSLAALLFLLPNQPLAGTLAVFLFNMTMPMTLWALSRIFSNARGFAFGTLTLALFLGLWITYLHPAPLLPTGIGFSIATLLSLILLTTAIRPLTTAYTSPTKT